MNTYLSTAPSFTNPQPLAASSPLTIPLQITLSQFRLSGFIILVFSKAKGVTLVFRNDPLESLVVSSTFDSIPFIKDYLQQEIEKQLRNLFQDELPAIIHRLSLQWCGNEYDSASSNTMKPPPVPQTPSDGRTLSTKSSFDNLGGVDQSATPFSFGTDPEADTLSSKNLLRLATLMDSQRTLSLFTPSIREAVYRAWATTGDRSDPTSTPSTSGTTTSTTYTFDNTPSRPSLTSIGSSISYAGSMTGMSPNGRPVTRSSPHGKKKKTRVVNLRKTKTSPVDDDNSSIADSSTSETSMYPGSSIASYDENSGEVKSPPITPPRDTIRKSDKSRKPLLFDDINGNESQLFSKLTLEEQSSASRTLHHAGVEQSTNGSRLPKMRPLPERANPVTSPSSHDFTSPTRFFSGPRENATSYFGANSTLDYSSSPIRPNHHSRLSTGSSIAEKALMMKVANEMARRLTDERALREKAEEMFDEERMRARIASSPPPAYKVEEY